MSPLEGHTSGSIDYDVYWQSVGSCYHHYPTIRHRQRYILCQLQRRNDRGSMSLFDVGCGDGVLLAMVQERFRLPSTHIGGSDLSAVALARARARVHGDAWFHDAYPITDRQFDVIICSEVIEHTTDYQKTLQWVYQHLREGGAVILTTQAGKIHQSDVYTGHTQHFRLRNLISLLEDMGFHIVKKRHWGFPFFTLQKYLTDIWFDTIRRNYLEGKTLSFRQRVIFSVAYWLFFVHDMIPFGPQIYIVAQKKST